MLGLFLFGYLPLLARSFRAELYGVLERVFMFIMCVHVIVMESIGQWDSWVPESDLRCARVVHMFARGFHTASITSHAGMIDIICEQRK